MYSHKIIYTHCIITHVFLYMYKFIELGLGTGEPWNFANLYVLYGSPFTSFLYLFSVSLREFWD